MDVIYTLAPLAVGDVAEPMMALKHVRYRGVDLYAQWVADNHYRVLQLCTSNPADYLRDDIAPGAMISL